VKGETKSASTGVLLIPNICCSSLQAPRVMSETEVQIRDQQLETLTGEIKEIFEGLEKSKYRDRDIDDIDNKLKQFDTALDTMHLDLKSLEQTVRRNYMKKFKTHKANKKQWEVDLEWRRKNTTKVELFDGHEKEKTAADMNGPGAIMDHGKKVQVDTTKSLETQLGLIKDARDLGQATLAKVSTQNQQISGMIDDLHDIDNILDRANLTIRRIARKLATDKYLWVLIFLVIAAILFIIIWKNTGGKSASVDTPTVSTTT